MLKNKFLLLGVIGLISLSSCGIFHKGCGCPTFGKASTMRPGVNVQIG